MKNDFGFSMAVEQVAVKDGFVPTSTSLEWYKNLKHYSSCLRLYDLLREEHDDRCSEKCELIHELGPEGITI